MSGVYPYCIVGSGHQPPPGLTGLDGAAVRAHDVGPFSVWISERAEAPELALERVAQHHEVVRVAAGSATPLPVRFGSWAPDRGVLSRRIERDQARLETTLAAVSGRVEFGVRIAEEGPEPGGGTEPARTPADGRTYLRELSRSYEEKRRRRGRREAVVRELEARLEGLPRDERIRPLEAPELVAVAHLVARADETRYCGLLDAFARRPPANLRVSVTGPWPPYSFVAP